MSGILDWMDELVSKFWDKILDFLPRDPFQDIIASLKYGEISKYFGYINYFFPVKFLLVALGAFLRSLAAYYSVSVGLRWIRAVD